MNVLSFDEVNKFGICLCIFSLCRWICKVVTLIVPQAVEYTRNRIDYGTISYIFLNTEAAHVT